MKALQAIAEQLARQRIESVLARIHAVIASNGPGTEIQRSGDELRVRGRGLKARWLSESGLRFARRILP